VAIQNLSKPVRNGHWPLFRDCGNMRGQYKRGRVNRLYQWLFRRASFFHSDPPSPGNGRTVHTEVTVERQGMTLLLGDAATTAFEVCPLCGQKFAPAHAGHTITPLQKASISQEPTPAAHERKFK
jgi:hypothetical protein